MVWSLKISDKSLIWGKRKGRSGKEVISRRFRMKKES